MNTTKAHIAALSLLDRALTAMTNDEIVALLAGLPEDHVRALERIGGVVPTVRTAAPTEPAPIEPNTDETLPADTLLDDAPPHDAPSDDTPSDDAGSAGSPPAGGDPQLLVDAIRAVAGRGRVNGDLQRLGVVMSDPCLADCVLQLGDHAEMPSEADLREVLPGLVERHGVGAVRLMLASTVAGEAPASATIIGLLKNDEDIKLPPVDPRPVAPPLPRKDDDPERMLLRAQRKERKAQEQAVARLRREQVARSRNRT